MHKEDINFTIKDVAIFPTPDFNAPNGDTAQAYPPLNTRKIIRNDTFIEKLPRDLSDQIMTACEPKGASDYVRQFGQLYSFIRKNAPATPPLEWDSDERLQICIGLSRIIHPTTISFGYSARIRHIDEAILEIIPGPVSGFGAHAYVSSENCRNWLTESEANELAKLVELYFSTDLPTRIRQAVWYLEYAFRTYFLDIRWPLICMGLESLIHTDKKKSTKQFSFRVSKLAKDIGRNSFNEDRAEDAYATRSSLVHGQKISNLEGNKLSLYEELENILREAIKKSILDNSFAAIFVSDNNIRDKWPID